MAFFLPFIPLSSLLLSSFIDSSSDDDDDFLEDADSCDGSIGSDKDAQNSAHVGSKRKLSEAHSDSCDGSIGSDKDAQKSADVGSKRKLSEAQPPSVAVAASVAPGSDVASPADTQPPKRRTKSTQPPKCRKSAIDAIVSDAGFPADAQSPKRLSKSAIYDIVIKSEFLQLPAEFIKRMCNDSGLDITGNKSAMIKRLQARYLNKYTKVFSE